MHEGRSSTSPSDAPLLAVRDLTVTFGAATAVRDVSVDVHAGRTLAIVGESGSGKSVTALSVLRLLPPTAQVRGSIVAGGRDLLTLPLRAMQRVRGGEIAMIFQEPMSALNPVMTVGEQIIEAIRRHRRVTRREARTLAVDALREVAIDEPAARVRAYPHELSGGMCQRVMIAMALACQPRLLIADEPTTALDVTVQKAILDLLADLQQRTGMALLLITHDLGVVAQHAHDVAVMYAGRIVETGPTASVLNAPQHPYTRALLRCAPRLGERRRRLTTVAETMSEEEMQRCR